ncbi:MAG: GNAT family N-acetyltransferase [Rickettsiales endosymbiont of Dermacentor nuttalli]
MNFTSRNIPKISDLNVLPNFSKHGIGTKLLRFAKEKVHQEHYQYNRSWDRIMVLHRDYIFN